MEETIKEVEKEVGKKSFFEQKNEELVLIKSEELKRNRRKIIESVGNEDLYSALSIIDHIRNEAMSNLDYGLDLSCRDFILRMQFLNPQQYGYRIQRFIAQRFDFKEVLPNVECGDLVDNFGDGIEVKSSIINGQNDKINMMKIRPWERTSYICTAFDVRKDCNSTPTLDRDEHPDFYIHFFRLSHSEMLEEIEKIGATITNGKLANHNVDDKNVEMTLRLKIDENDENYKRWSSKYRSFGYRKLYESRPKK